VANVEFALAVPDTNRGQAFGFVVSGMMVGQGVGLILAGLFAEYLSPMSVVAIAGLLTVLGAASLVRPSDSRKSYG
jgi:predicted MFS family arabinose efflux permease